MPAAAIMGRIYSEPGEKSQVAVEKIRQVLTGASQVDQPCSGRVPSGNGALGNFGVFAFSSKLAEAHFAAHWLLLAPARSKVSENKHERR